MSSPKAPQANQDSTEPIIIITTKTPGIAPASESKQQQQHPPSDHPQQRKKNPRTCVCDVSPIYFRLPYRAHIALLFTRGGRSSGAVSLCTCFSSSHRVCVSESHNNCHQRHSTTPPEEIDRQVNGGKMWWKSEKSQRWSHYFLLSMEDGV